ncbi:SusC/RagA family TonB-linked outer membrane protein [Pararcticibacter amylolyticus]|uniref:SusC/RagA family TonB-linked outer membrane protein n=1 Tax=Pararcticibacter amylolyticus TaxID=2173175 RepID=A0A2U2PC98_9SPHI|nr:SusC/RagA family TonB-linked outer membrane protein [Pararcticibacter amylolyticus]PWG79002.1 SusC/RagA family TonB-linked outer membrane protein [Pararcticibacter amylolyticus]
MCNFNQKLKAFILYAVISAGLFPVMRTEAAPVLPLAPDSLAVPPQSVRKTEGIVKDASTGKPVAGVNVSVAGFSSAFTDEKGRFKISVPSGRAALKISLEGYQDKIVPVGQGKLPAIFIQEESYNSQFTHVSLPFYEGPKVTVPFSVASVNPGGGWSANSETPDTYLQGRATGLNSIRRSGTPGIGANLFMRGFSSLAATSQPLVVVDGVIYDTGVYGSSIISGNTENPLGFIDPKDIDNITVVRDGGSLYGTKGANGVIFITTIRAKEEATRIDFAAYGGLNFKVKDIPLMGASAYRSYLSDILQDRGWSPQMIASQPYMNDNINPQYYNYHNNTNWQDEVMGNGSNQNYYLKVTGGDDIATYGLSVGFINNDGLINNTNNKKYHTRFNGDLKLSSKLSSTVNLSFMNNEQNLRDGGQAYLTNPLYLASVKAPFLSTHQVSENGVVSPNLADKDIFNIANPVVAVNDAIGKNRNYRFFGSVGFNYAFSKNLKLGSVVGVTYNKMRENMFIPEKGMVHDSLSTAAISNRSGTNVGRLLMLYNDTRLSYSRIFNHINTLSANLGIRYSSSKTENDFGYGYNSATDDLISVGQGAGALREIGGGLGNSRWLSTYLNVDYNYLNTYFLSFNMAADGSSRFGTEASGGLSVSGNRYALMPGIAAAWLLSSEKFMKDMKWLDILKLRASYSLTGNDDIGNYSAKRYYISQNLLGMQGLIPGNIGNPALKWETVYKTNAGADISIWHERLNVSADFYSNRTKDMLSWRNVSTAAGLKNVLTNEGEMTSKGFEVTVNARVLNKALKWDLGLGLAKYKNEVVSIPGGSMISTFGGATFLTSGGSAPNLFYGYKTRGVFSSSAEAEAAGLYTVLSDGSVRRFSAGDIHFVNNVNSEEDLAAGRTYIDESDRQVIGDPNPDFTGSFSSSFNWKRWSFGTLFTFSKGNDIYNAQRAALESQSGVENQTLNVLNRWRSEGQLTDVPRLGWGDPMGNARFSDRWIEDGSYLRLRTVSLSYNLNLKGVKLFKYASVYATANNLFTWTKYKGYDPEFSAGPGVFAQGVDTGLQPLFRSTQLGIRIGL